MAVVLTNQRVGIFVDIQNLYYSSKALYKAKVDFGEILKQGLKTRKLVRAIAYVVKTDVVKKESNFFEALEKRGYEIKSKDLQIFYGGNKKGDWDIGIAMDIVRMAPKLDVVILVSGDGDFTELIKYAKANGCFTEVMAFGRSASAHLKEETDKFVDLDAMKEDVLIKTPVRKKVRKNKSRYSKK